VSLPGNDRPVPAASDVPPNPQLLERLAQVPYPLCDDGKDKHEPDDHDDAEREDRYGEDAQRVVRGQSDHSHDREGNDSDECRHATD
jgi:hypothetical protein